MTLAEEAALAVAAAGIAVAVVATAVGRWRDGVTSALELWVAAGLLRLAFAPDLPTIMSAAAIIAVRRLVGAGLRSSPLRPPRRGIR